MKNSEIENKSVGFFLQILSESRLPIVVTDALAEDQSIIYANPAFESITGYAVAEIRGRNCRFLQGDDRDQMEIAALKRTIELGEPGECLLRNYRKNGTCFWNQLYIYPIRDHADVVTNFVGVLYDATSSHKASLAEVEVQDAIESSTDICLKLAPDGTIASASRAVRSVLGLAAETFVGTNFLKLIDRNCPVDDDLDFKRYLTRAMSATGLVLAQHARQDGAVLQLEWNVFKGPVSGTWIALGRDVTARCLLEADARTAHEKTRAVLESIKEGCFSLDTEWRFTFINRQGAELLARKAEDLIGNNIWDEFPAAVGGVYHQTYQRAMATKAYAECDAYYAPVGRWLNARAYPSDDGLTVFFLDISARKRDEQQMLYAASHDQLTGLMNREACLQRIEDTLARAVPDRLGALAVLFVDLDRFKEVNDALGHRVGDHVLRLVGERLKRFSNESRYCARLSGDEFLFVLDPANVEMARNFAKRLLDHIVKPYEVVGQRLTIGASIGISVATETDAVSASDLVNQADTAMYAAKASGRLAVRLFRAEVEPATRRRLQLRTEMAAALESGQFLLHYQPQIRLTDGTISGVEALIRWNHPTYGLLSPAEFLEIAEESPLILQLGAWVCDEACRQLARWEALGHELQIAINVSARQLVDPDFPEVVLQSVERHGVDPHKIELEITETMLSQDIEASAEILTRLAEEGFKVALDDFGTGFSNLAYINRLPVSVIKIDRSFVADIDTDPKAMDLVKGIVALAKSLKLGVICEGVETVEQRHALEKTQCDMIQGYLISKPLPGDDLLDRFLKE